jgi:hypothetical protein
MKKLLIFSISLLALVAALLLFVQSAFVKDKIVRVLHEMALQQGMHLKIESLEGELPLKWTLSNVHLTLSHTDSVDIDVLRLRLSLISLLRGKIGISYLSAGHITYQFTPSDKEPTFMMPPPLSIRSFKVREFTVMNLATNENGTYAISGHCNVKKKHLSFFAKATSPDLSGELFIQGSKKTGQMVVSLKFDAKSNLAFAPFVPLPYSPMSLDAQGSGPWKTWENLISSKPSPQPIHGALQLHHEDLAITSQFSLFSNRAFDLHSFHLTNKEITAQGNGSFTPHLIPTALHATFQLLSHAVQGKIDLSENTGQLLLHGEHLGPFPKAYLAINAHHEQKMWQGDIHAAATHPDLSFDATAKFRVDYPLIELHAISLQGPEVALHGDLSSDLKHLHGGLTFQLNNLAPFSQFVSLPLGGRLGGTVDFQGIDLRCHALAKGVKAGSFLAQDLALDLFATDIFNNIGGQYTFDARHAYLADIFFTSATAQLTKESQDWNYEVDLQGDWKKPFSLQAKGDFAFSPDALRFSCNTLHGHLLQKNVSLAQPFNFSYQDKTALLTNLNLNVADGYFYSALQTTPESSRVLIEAKHFPLDFLSLLSPRFTFYGLASCDIDLAGTNTDLTGHCSLLLEHADILPAGSTTPIETKASLQANLNHDTLQLHTHIVATHQQFANISLTLPLTYQLFPWCLAITPNKTIAGNTTIEGNIEQLFDFINVGAHRFGGFLSSRLVISGTRENPTLYGPLEIQQGFYHNDFVGIALTQGHLQGTATGDTVVASIEANDEKSGTATATAHFQLQPLLPFTIQGTISHFQVIEFDWLSGTCSGPFTLSGNLEKGLIAGNLAIDKAAIQIPDRLPSETPTLPITFLHLPEALTAAPPPSKSYPFHYDLQIAGDHDIRLSGRGLEADLAGHLHLTGKNLDAVPIGTLQAIKGNFYFAGRDFKISSGELSFSEKGSFLNMAANLDLPAVKGEKNNLPALTVTLRLRGALRNPEIIFESNPSLPTSTLFARILFNKDVEELSASQIVQLANTLMTLSSSSAPDFLGTLRRTLGVDRLSVSASEDGSFSIEIGKSISTEILKGVAATLTQNTENSQIKVEVELKGGFILSGETQADDQGKFSFKWNKNY